MDFTSLYEIAKNITNPRKLSEFATCGDVGTALITDKGNIYKGICIDAACSIGFCAEHSAIAAMITSGETIIEKIISVGKEGNIISPCGRCRELISQVNIKNIYTKVMISKNKIITIKELLPHDFKIYYQKMSI